MNGSIAAFIEREIDTIYHIIIHIETTWLSYPGGFERELWVTQNLEYWKVIHFLYSSLHELQHEQILHTHKNNITSDKHKFWLRSIGNFSMVTFKATILMRCDYLGDFFNQTLWFSKTWYFLHQHRIHHSRYLRQISLRYGTFFMVSVQNITRTLY